MKDYWKLMVAFAAWVVILLAAFALIVLSLAAVTVDKPLIVIVCTLIIISAVAVKLFDPTFTKKVTSATGK